MPRVHRAKRALRGRQSFWRSFLGDSCTPKENSEQDVERASGCRFLGKTEPCPPDPRSHIQFNEVDMSNLFDGAVMETEDAYAFVLE